MNGLKDQLMFLSTIESYYKIAERTSIKGLKMLDIPETRGWILITFTCPDRHFPEYSFEVEFKVTKPFFDKHLSRILDID